jgi:superoxide reductase
MNDRRDFLKTTAVAASLLALGSVRPSFAAGMSPEYTNIIFTNDNPGIWKGKQGIHVPQVTVTGSEVKVVTNHPMSAQHFIVRHTLVLADGTSVGSQTFTPADKPESTYELPMGYKGKFYVSSFCNLHDFWLVETMA